MALNFDALLQNIAPVSGGDGQQPQGVTGVNVTAPAANPNPGSDFNRSIYNNSADQRMAQQGQQQAPQHSGMFGIHGTLRNVLGVLGDALLVQQGQKPVFAPRIQQEKEADAMAGFQSDPRAAAGRLAALPGAQDLARNVFDAYQTQQLRAEQQKSREAQEQENRDYHNSLEQDRQDKRNANTMQFVGGMLKSGAATNDPAKYQAAYARAQAYAKQRGIDDITAYGVPDKLEDAMAGFGMTANQVGREATSNRSIDERGNAAEVAHEDRRYSADHRPQPNPTAGSTLDKLLEKQNTGQPLTPAEQQYWDANVTNKGKGKRPLPTPPGLTVNNPPASSSSKFINGKTYTDAHGNKATYNNGNWVPVH